MNSRVTKIDELHDEMNRLRLEERCYYSFKRLANEMLLNISELAAEESDEDRKKIIQEAYRRLSHTNSKEIEYIKYHQDLMHKKNAAKVRATEYYAAVKTAVEQVYSDIWGIHER